MKRAARTRAVLVLALSLGFSMMIAGGADAGALDDAKAAGFVGERADGYLGVVDGAAPGAVKALAADINAKRRAKYQGIADANGTSLQAVEAIVGNKLIERAQPGQYVMDATGRWVPK
jgi:hypothetical protein